MAIDRCASRAGLLRAHRGAEQAGAGERDVQIDGASSCIAAGSMTLERTADPVDEPRCWADRDRRRLGAHSYLAALGRAAGEVEDPTTF
jgi:hypothetical protein